ncbi:MAG: DUF294 nucleotidyltransferase-like domain-containing protein, partial [Thermoguttaceae bacterium]
MPSIRANIVEAKARLAAGYEDFKRRHQAGCSGVELCSRIADFRDALLLDLIHTALDDLGESGPRGLLSQMALVAHGGYGRREVAPFSDVDLMIIHRSDAAGRVTPFAERMLRDVFDSGLILGHSVCTPHDACRQACNNPESCTSLVDTQLLVGDEDLYQHFRRLYRKQVDRHARRLIAEIERSRLTERIRFGETVFLLEPDLKRSSGALRDLQM